MLRHTEFILKVSFIVTLIVTNADLNGQLEMQYGARGEERHVEWINQMYSANPNPGDVIALYEAYYQSNPFVKNRHTQYFKRWIRSLSRQTGPEIVDRDAWKSYKKTVNKYLARKNSMQRTASSANWSCIGPFDWDHEAASRSNKPGACHVYTVEQSISNPDVLYAGTATSGIWKTIDRGLNWTSITANAMVNQCTALEIDHTNANVVYGEYEGSIYKTIDGGANWTVTGDGQFNIEFHNVLDIRQHPSNSNILLAATDVGMYRTTDAGTSWDTIMVGEFQEIEFYPGAPDTVYVIKRNGNLTEFYKSIDNGINFTLKPTGWPMPDLDAEEDQRRTELAVTTAAPNKVYALATGEANGGSGLYGVYVSNDAGESWTFECCGPQPAGPPSQSNMNLMGWSAQGTDDGGQYYYDLAFDVSPNTADSVFVAGINLWVSDDGGASFICPAKHDQPHKPNYVHADIHDLHYYEHSNEIWLACDGGIFFSSDNGANFTRRMAGIAGTDFWGFGAGFWDGDIMLGGTYHNGTLLKDNDVYTNDWLSTDGGDNFRGFVNYGIPNEVFSDYDIKLLPGDRTVEIPVREFLYKPNAGSSTNPPTFVVGKSSELMFHPWYYDTWYSGKNDELWMTEDGGLSFSLVHDFGEELAAFDISWSNPNYMYVSTWPGGSSFSTKKIYKTTDRGVNWVEVTPSSAVLGGGTNIPYDIAISASDPDSVWILRTPIFSSTNIDGKMVYLSDDGGATWQNITTSSLDGELCTNLIHQKGTDGGIYIGTRRTVYYKNNSMAEWEMFNAGLPASTNSTRLVPYYRNEKIRNATNRSVWESDIYESSSPVAYPAAKRSYVNCYTDTVRFTSHSVQMEQGASWLWSFPGGSPSTSTERNPKVVYGGPGTYTVSLTVEDPNGTHSRLVPGFITVRDGCGADKLSGLALLCESNPDHANIGDLDLNTNEMTVTAWIRPTGIQNNFSAIWMHDGISAGLNVNGGNSSLGYHWPNGSNSWNSGMVLNSNEWNHVAMVVEPTGVTVYLNGESSKHNFDAPAVDFGTSKIGSFKGVSTRNFEGAIDEVCIYKRSLTKEEIRLQKHLIHDPVSDPDIIAYYQFNEEGNIVKDNAGDQDGILNGNAQKVNSLAPVSWGTSAMITVNNGGPKDFVPTGVILGFPNSGLFPNGPVVVSRLEESPKVIPSGRANFGDQYFIVNNYGNSFYSDMDSIRFNDFAFISNAMTSLNNLGDFYVRDTYDDGSWTEMITSGMTVEAGIGGAMSYPDASDINFEQWMVLRDSLPEGTAYSTFKHPNTSLSTQRGGESILLDAKGIKQGIQLPIYTSEQIDSVPQPLAGSMVYDKEEHTIVYFDGTQWVTVLSLEEDVESGGAFPGPGSVIIGISADSHPSAILSMCNGEGVVIPPVISDTDLLNIKYPTKGLMVFNEDEGRLQAYHFSEWTSLAVTPGAWNVNENPSAVSKPGIAIGALEKTPNAILELVSNDKGWKIPVVSANDIPFPVEGLLIFDPGRDKLMVSDGSKWRRLLFE